MICSRCGRDYPPKTKFCTSCGVPLAAARPPQPRATAPETPHRKPQQAPAPARHQAAPPAPAKPAAPPVRRPEERREPSTPVCTKCGAALKPGKKFCLRCGAAAVDLASPPPSSQPAQLRLPNIAVPEGIVGQLGLPALGDMLPPPPPAAGQLFVFNFGIPRIPVGLPGRLRRRSPEPPLPPAVPPWAFQDQFAPLASQLGAIFTKAGSALRSGFAPMLARMIRAALLDKTVYREVAGSAGLQREAWTAMMLIIGVGLGTSILRLVMTMQNPLALLTFAPIVLLQIAGWLAGVWVVQAAAILWLKRKLTFRQLFRALSYASTPAVLGIIPYAGPYLALWSLVTGTAATRDVAGCDTVTAAVITGVKFVFVMMLVQLLSPTIQIPFRWISVY